MSLTIHLHGMNGEKLGRERKLTILVLVRAQGVNLPVIISAMVWGSRGGINRG